MSALEATLDSRAAEFVRDGEHMAALAQQPYIHNYNDVGQVSLNATDREQKDISLLRHFWQRVEAVALEGPPRLNVPYRFIRNLERSSQAQEVMLAGKSGRDLILFRNLVAGL